MGVDQPIWGLVRALVKTNHQYTTAHKLKLVLCCSPGKEITTEFIPKYDFPQMDFTAQQISVFALNDD